MISHVLAWPTAWSTSAFMAENCCSLPAQPTVQIGSSRIPGPQGCSATKRLAKQSYGIVAPLGQVHGLQGDPRLGRTGGNGMSTSSMERRHLRGGHCRLEIPRLPLYQIMVSGIQHRRHNTTPHTCTVAHCKVTTAICLSLAGGCSRAAGLDALCECCAGSALLTDPSIPEIERFPSCETESRLQVINRKLNKDCD